MKKIIRLDRYLELPRLLAVMALIFPLVACGGGQGELKQTLEAQRAISLTDVVSSQLAPLELAGQEYLVLASESQGLVLVSADGAAVTSVGDGSVERFALQKRQDESWLVIAADESRSAIRVFGLEIAGGAPRFELLASQDNSVPLVALCSANHGKVTQLFAMDESGLGHEYRLHPSEEGWRFTEVRALHFGEQVTSCAVDERRQQLLVAQPPLGIWQLNASAERDELRRVFLPGQNLEGEFAGLWLDAQRDLLWLASGDSLSAHALSQPGEPVFSGALKDLEPVSVALFSEQLVFLQEESDKIYRSPVASLPQVSEAVVGENAVETHEVAARAETVPVGSGGDAADDPAIWVHPTDSASSLILGTDKKQGLNVYSLDGTLLQSFEVGRVNNVDLRPVKHPRYQAIAAASNRTTPGISLFGISAEGVVESLGLQAMDLEDPYGLCLYQQGADLFAWMSDKEGALHLAEIELGAVGEPWQLRRRADLPVKSQVEGCVADDERRTLFFGEEDAGVWRLDIAAFLKGEGRPQLVAPADGQRLVADVEGLDLYLQGDAGYLVVSSQGDNSYALYSRDGSEFVGRFRVGENLGAGVDGSSETDGLAVTSHPLGAEYPMGLLVVQDGRNRMPAEAQNFKLVSWAEIADSLKL